MKRTIAFLFLSVFFCASYAEKIGDFFISLPENYLIQLGRDQRTELINGAKDSIVNTYGGISRLVKSDSSFIYVRISGQGSIQIKKWTSSDSSSLYAVSYWVCGPACDGILRFFKENYEPVNMFGLFPEISIRDFINVDSLKEGVSMEQIESKFDLFFIRFEFESDSDDVIVVNDNKNYMNSEDYAKIKPYLKGDRIKMSKKGDRFEKGNAYFE